MKLAKPEFHPLLKVLGNTVHAVVSAALLVYWLLADESLFDGFLYWLATTGLAFQVLGGYRGASLAWREWRQTPQPAA
ncbi:hypothetical protein AB0G79_23025 [Streptomyces sp. NPDC020807]|uniref:hypothetical protein n=1 Tax=Streptomyces sp. NPDC020807 TaxID=3155119 RepID=UPI0034083102